jgi:predicted anti-sigma-YlaC factor YlaD
MHQPIRDNLEEYLKGSARKVPQDFEAHLEACDDCASQLRFFQAQATMLRALQSDGDIEPSAGFYARVMDRIELDGRSSIWAVLLQPNFGRRIAMASAVLVVLLGTYFVTAESREPLVPTAPEAAFTSGQTSFDQDSLQQQRQRDAVLVNLAAFHE